MSRGGTAVAAAAFVAVAAAAIYVGPTIYDQLTATTAPDRCTVDNATASYSLSAEQADNAALIAAAGWAYGFDEAGVTVALATAIQESGLRNLNYGDRDSVGLFQQRTSQGWGTLEQIMDPRYSAAMFFLALAKVEGWETMPVTVAAQTVQRSGFPDAYADHEAEARAWAHALGGLDGTVTCELNAPEVSSAKAFSDRVALDFGQGNYGIDVLGYEGDETTLGVRPSDTSDQTMRRLQAWAIATSPATGVTSADLNGERWQRDGAWQRGASTPEFAEYPGVRVTVRTSE